MVLPLNLILQEIIDKYNLNSIVYNSNVYMEINNEICSLKEPGALANEQLQQYLAPCGYKLVKWSPEL